MCCRFARRSLVLPTIAVRRWGEGAAKLDAGHRHGLCMRRGDERIEGFGIAAPVEGGAHESVAVPGDAFAFAFIPEQSQDVRGVVLGFAADEDALR